MPWTDLLKGDSLAWLLESKQPGIRYLALRDLLDRSENDTELRAARNLAHKDGPIAKILAKMKPEGYWAKPGPGYNPKYRSTVWAVILLAQLGASAKEDARVATACTYMLDHALLDSGIFTASGASSGTADCLQGNLVWSLMELGCKDVRLHKAIDWTARSVTGEGIAPLGSKGAVERYYAGNCGPGFACGANNKQPCAWGGVKVMMALGSVPEKLRTPAVHRAIRQGADFFFQIDPATAEYPTWTGKPSRNWWKYGFPVFYVTDLVQLVEALALGGFARDKRLSRSVELILGKQDSSGRWALEYDYTGKIPATFGAKGKPNEWVTLRALRVIKLAGRLSTG